MSGLAELFLSKEVEQEIRQVRTDSEKRTQSVINDLFGGASGGHEAYKKPFLRLLCFVFSKLSDAYVQLITVKKSPEGLAENHILSAALDDAIKSEKIHDPAAFKYGVNRFFRESSPLFDEIKWNMAQNFYIAKALGITGSADLLTADIFKGSTLYCDTNVLIAGLSPEGRHYNSLQALSKSCKVFEMNLTAAHPTVEELNIVVTAHAELLSKVIDVIPDGTAIKIRDFLLEAYLAEKNINPSITMDDFIEKYETPLKALTKSFGVVEEDDKWFISAEADPETKQLSKELIKAYETVRHRPKSERAAMHDALLLKWVAYENSDNRKSWFVTLDLTLADWVSRQTKYDFKVITLDALLQWMTPVAYESSDEDKLVEIFAEAIRYQLLPRDTFFLLRDFQVFAEMGIEAKQLPEEDVEACIREIKKTGPNLDPAKAEDREKIGRVIQRYFVDPGTKYKRSIQEMQSRAEGLSQQLDQEVRMRAEAESKTHEIGKKSSEREEQLVRELHQEKESRATAESRLAKLEQDFDEGKNRTRHRRLVNSAAWLTLGVFIIFLTRTSRNQQVL